MGTQTSVDPSFGELMRRARELAGVSREEVARASGRSLNTLARLERDGVRTRRSTIVAVARGLRSLGIDVSRVGDDRE